MKVAGIAKGHAKDHLRALKQIGIDDLVYYDMAGMPLAFDELDAVRKSIGQFGLRVAVVEGGPPMDQIVAGGPGRDVQIEQYKVAIGNMGRLGIGVLCYNFMPQLHYDAMVMRTSFDTPERGGALTSSFDLSAFDNEERTKLGESSDDEVWDNLAYFLRQVVPAAEAAEVKLAMHPDDPPLSPMCHLARIMRSVDNFQRLVDLVPSPVNGITLCQGCFVEMGEDPGAVARRFAEHLHFIHVRDVRGTPENFVETFPDNGPTDMAALIRTYHDIGFDGHLRTDHVPHLATDPGPGDGYGMHGHLFAMGYLKGLIEAVA
jgi:mannonate dehydratase